MLARTLRTSFIAAVVALSVVPAAAFASPSSDAATETAAHVKKEKASFPMSGADFKARVEGRMAKRREKITERLAAKNVPADKQKLALAKFDERSAKVMVEVDKVAADGTVTKDEAKAVHKAMRGNHKGHKKGAAKKNG